MYFGAGWDHSGETNQPRHIHSARPERMAILTTRPPGFAEKDRLVIGFLFIDRLVDAPGEETKISGDRQKSIEIDYENIKVRFWDYYKNAGDEKLILWASGLFRYISDSTVLNVLRSVGEQYVNAGRDVSKIIAMIAHYEKLTGKAQPT